MFHNAHVYIASNLYKTRKDLLIVGSFLPDIAVTGIIKWEGGLHGREAANDFSRFMLGKYPSKSDLSNGILAHNVLDDFTHKDYRRKTGFAFQNNKEIAQLVKEFYGLNDKDAKGMAHNYIESGVDILLLKEHPEIQDQIQKTINQIDKQKLANLLASYFDIDEDKFLEALLKFFGLFTKYDFTQKDNWILFWRDLEKWLSLRDIENQKRKELLNRSINIVKNTYQDFLDYSLEEGKIR